MLRDRPPKGPYVSKQAAMYTRDMNMMIVAAFKKHHENHEAVATPPLHGCRNLTSSPAKRLEFADALRPVEFTERLRGNDDTTTNYEALGGMRKTAQSMKKVPGAPPGGNQDVGTD